jgi:hypothetical protein
MVDLDDYLRREVARRAAEVDPSGVLEDVRRRVRRRRAIHRAERGLLAVTVLTATVAGGLVLWRAFTPHQQQPGGPVEAEMAFVAVDGRMRVTLVAERSPRGSAATVQLEVSIRSGPNWSRAGTVLVEKRKSWRWESVRGGEAVCRLSARDVPTPRIEVSLLVSSTAGCSREFAFTVRNGRLVSEAGL